VSVKLVGALGPIKGYCPAQEEAGGNGAIRKDSPAASDMAGREKVIIAES